VGDEDGALAARHTHTHTHTYTHTLSLSLIVARYLTFSHATRIPHTVSGFAYSAKVHSFIYSVKQLTDRNCGQ